MGSLDSTTSLATDWIRAQRLVGPSMKDAPVFYRNLEEALDARRATHHMAILRSRDGLVDFSSNDFLSLSRSDMLREAFLAELAANPNFSLGSTGSRLLDGHGSYVDQLEREIADFHGAETALVVNSGYDGNGAIFHAIPRAGDVVVYDELVHASTHDGMKHSMAQTQLPFRHNEPDDLEETLVGLKESNELLRTGQRCVIIAVEAVYSMDGDVCPLREMVQVARQVFPKGNAQFVVDEAHSSGVLGDSGRGLVSALGLEKEIAVRLHTYGKAHAATGAAILCNKTVRGALLNFARPLIYTTSPSFPMLATIRAGYNLLRAGKTRERRERMLELVRYFFQYLATKPEWEEAVDSGVCSIPLSEDWEDREFTTQFVPLWTRAKYNYYLMFHLQVDGICAFPIDPPVVPRGTGRVRLVIHTDNTEEQIRALADSICRWAAEMMDLERRGKAGTQLPGAMRKMYAIADEEGVQRMVVSDKTSNPFVD